MDDIDQPILVIGSGTSGLAVAFELLHHWSLLGLAAEFRWRDAPAAGAMIDSFGKLAQLKHREGNSAAQLTHT